LAGRGEESLANNSSSGSIINVNVEKVEPISELEYCGEPTENQVP
jgi:hypothetical protein